MKQVKRISISIFLIILGFVACEAEPEIDYYTLAKVYVDILIVEDFYKDSDSLEIKREDIFTKYSMSEEFYDSSFTRFSYDREEWEQFFTLANTYLDSLKEEAKPQKLKERL